jgi:hypothetical protein
MNINETALMQSNDARLITIGRNQIRSDIRLAGGTGPSVRVNFASDRRVPKCDFGE